MNNPIGIFDSGIGGLTVANAIRKILPNEQIIYFGDTSHLPYGDKSSDTINKYAKGITHFLINKRVKAVVIACNTASALANETVKNIAGEIPVFNVISPVTQYSAFQGFKKIGVIGTRATIGSGIYQDRIKEINPNIDVSSLATPLLVPMIEEGFFANSITHEIITNYLNNNALKDIDALILGCTHYPLIKSEIEKYCAEKITVLDSASIVAIAVKEKLEKAELLSDVSSNGDKFYISDYTESFAGSAKLFFGNQIKVKEARIWHTNNK